MKNSPFAFCYFLFLAWLVFHSAAGYGQSLQPFRFQSFTTQNGLSASEANGFSEDGRGFLWVATYDGICRFDGIQFKNYRLPVVDSNKISGSNLVVQIQCWEKQVWCLNSFGQLFKLDASRDIFVFSGFSIPATNNIKSRWRLEGFLFDQRRGCFWITTTTSLRKLDLASGGKEEVLHTKATISGAVLMDTQGKLWLNTSAGELSFDPATGLKTTYFETQKPTAHCLKGSMVWCLANSDTLCFMDALTGISGAIPTNATAFFNVQKPDCIEDITFAPGISGDSLLWIATCGNGVSVVNITNGKYLVNYNTDSYEDQGFLHDWVRSFYTTRDSCLWLSTQKGILKIDPRQQYFFTKKIAAISKIESSRIRQVRSNFLNQAEKWLATGDGLFLMGENKHTIIQKFLQPNETTQKSKLWARISAMQMDNMGNLWLGTDGGLVKVDASLRVKKFVLGQVGNEAIFDVIPLGKDAFWVRNSASAGLFWPERGQYFPINFPKKEDEKPKLVYYLNAGLNKSALFSTDSAVYRVKQSDLNLDCRCFPNPEIVYKGVSLMDIIENDSAIWGVTIHGLAEFHKSKGTLRIFGEKEGLTNLRVRSIMEDNNGQFWLNSDNGLFVFNTTYFRFKKYGEEDGLADGFIPGILSRDGNDLYAGFDSRFSVFRPVGKLIKTNVKPFITNVFALDERLPVDFSATDAPSITVDYTQNILRFEFTCPDFYQSEKITFQFQLEGFDAARRDAGFNRSVVYTNLDGGTYRFLVWAINADGFPCEQPAVVLLRVVPPFYRTWWFYGLCFVFTGLLFFLLFRYREIQRLRQEQLRLRIARDLHDDVGSTLSAISILSESALNGLQQDLDHARFGNIGDKARSALDSISDIVWSVNPENDAMEKALARMSAYASEMLENVGTELHLEVGAGVASLSLPMQQRKDFYLIFKEAIHNCAKYARATQVTVTLEKEHNLLIMCIKDNGIGFVVPPDASETRTLGGNGLRNMRSRAAALGGDLEVRSSVGDGTLVRLRMNIM